MKREMLGLALTGALLTGCASAPHSSEKPVSHPAPKFSGKHSGSSSNTTSGGESLLGSLLSPMTSQDKTVISNSFHRAESYWARRDPKLAGVTATRLMILSHDAEFKCPGATGKPEVIEASDANGTSYCQSLGKIVFTEGLVSYIHASRLAAHSKTVLKFFVYHEFGHAVQSAAGVLKSGERTTTAMERQADCDAGLVFAALDPSHIDAMESSFSKLPTGDSRHGLPHQRAASFEKGVNGGPC